MNKFELVFVPFPVIGHLRSTVEMAKLLVERENRLSISVIILPLLSGDDISSSAYIAALSAESNDRLRYVVIPGEDQPTVELHVENHIPKVKRAVAKLVDDYSKVPDSPRLAGLVVDMFCTSVIDVANEFSVPCYLYYTSNVGVLALGLHIQMLYDKKEYNASETDFEDSEVVLDVPSLTCPYPVKCLPYGLSTKEWLPMFVNQARRFREMKGILVNTFADLEPYALESLHSSGDTPRAYPVGPLLHLENHVDGSKDEKSLEILQWLDEQPPKSVVFLCFGSIGGFGSKRNRYRP